LYDALDESLRGREVGTSEYHEKRMEQRYAERMKEEAEFEAKLSQAGSSTWDEAENMESIHNHNAYASIERRMKD
ncbi:MAG TPA: hypothetical protein PLI56_05225, partial [Exilispira sp.]|nr:hypothetical protein [Exilispira sp.]